MSREEAITELKYIQLAVNSRVSEALEMAIKALEQEPCEDAVSRQSGKWKREEFPNFTVAWFCNKCGRGDYRKSNFCPNCGADMREPQESEEQTERE